MNKYINNLSLIFFLCLILGCQEQSSDLEHQSLSNEIDSFLNRHQDFNGVVLVTSDEKVIYSKIKGYRNIEKKLPLTIDDQFVIGSISKQITAVLVLKAFEKSQLKLDIPISNYLSNINQPWKDTVTIHHLLTHTHGITAIDEPLSFEVGTQFSYSQLGYELLANILEQLEERSFESISMSFFKEVGLENTFHPAAKGYTLINGYTENDGGLVFERNSLQNYVPAGSFISNATDLVKWNNLLHSNQLVKKETVDLMKTRYATREHPIFDKIEYGYGLLFKKGESNLEIGALGYAPAFSSALYHYPKTNMNLVVLSNVARNLNDFRKVFAVHTGIMEIVKN